MALNKYIIFLFQSLLVGSALIACDSALEDADQSAAYLPSAENLEPDQVPGFGHTVKGALRDDTIALWEAYKREQLVQKCMSTANLGYEVEVAFPTGVAVQVAASLSLPDAHDVERSSSGGSLGTLANVESNNYRRAVRLSVDNREHYFQTLYGESAADFEMVQRTGELPSGRSDFARDGCVGEAWKEVPGVYALKRSLYQEIERERVVALSRMLAAREIKSECSTSAGVTIESLAQLETISHTNGAVEDLAGCEKVLVDVSIQARNTSIQKVLGSALSVTQRQLKQYGKTGDSIAKDRSFMEFLAVSTHGLTIASMLEQAQDID